MLAFCFDWALLVAASQSCLLALRHCDWHTLGSLVSSHPQQFPGPEFLMAPVGLRDNFYHS